jgi:GMP synthase (glutamine-hydrolysing)
MLAIVDNGKGADEISRMIRMPHKIIKPSEINSIKATSYILSDGDTKHKEHNIKLIKSATKPILGIGTGYIFLGSACGAKAKEIKFGKQEKIKIERPCPLLLDLKKLFIVFKACNAGFADLPENFDVVASSQKYQFEIIQESEKPFFGVQFNPELGADGFKILSNFEKFVEVWEKYHKG